MHALTAIFKEVRTHHRGSKLEHDREYDEEVKHGHDVRDSENGHTNAGSHVNVHNFGTNGHNSRAQENVNMDMNSRSNSQVQETGNMDVGSHANGHNGHVHTNGNGNMNIDSRANGQDARY